MFLEEAPPSEYNNNKEAGVHTQRGQRVFTLIPHTYTHPMCPWEHFPKKKKNPARSALYLDSKVLVSLSQKSIDVLQHQLRGTLQLVILQIKTE